MPKKTAKTKPKATLSDDEREALQYMAQRAELAASLLKSGMVFGIRLTKVCTKAVEDFLKKH